MEGNKRIESLSVFIVFGGRYISNAIIASHSHY